jgi:thiol:disulfide interchange protein
MRSLVLMVVIALLSVTGWAQQPTTDRSLPYSGTADATRDIDQAMEKAKAKNQRVLLDVGANWCGWCIRLHQLFMQDKVVAAMLADNYQVVYVDAGQGDKNRDIFALYGLNVKNYPHLAILDPEGNLITQQDAEAFEIRNKYDADKVAEFLDKWRSPNSAVK